MSELLSLHDAVAGLVRPGDTVALEGFTHLIPFAAGHEVIRQGIGELTLIRMTPDLLYDQMIGVRPGEAPGVLVGRQPRRRLAAPAARRGRARLAAAARDRGAQPRGDGARLRRRRGGHAGGVLPRLLWDRISPRSTRTSGSSTCPFTGERLAAVPAHPARRRDRPRAEGRPRGQRAARGHRRRAEGSGARRAALAGHGRRGRRRAAARQPQRRRPAVVDGDRHRGRARAARSRRTRTATTRATTRSTSRGTRSRAIASAFQAWIDEHVLSRSAEVGVMSWYARSR